MRPAALCLSILPFGVALFAPALPVQAQATVSSQESAQMPFAVLLTDGGGLDENTQRTLRGLVFGALRHLGHPVDESIATLPAQTPNRRVLALRVAGRLGTKVPLFLEELGPNGTVVASTSLTAATLEECDIVIPRLVQALLQRKPVEDTARMTTMTQAESRELRRRPGTSHFIVGMNAPLYSASGKDKDTTGFSIGYLYNSPRWMVGAEAGGSSAGDTSISYPIMIHAAYLFSDGPASVYLGGGMGYLTVKEKGASFDNRIGFRLSGGVEFFRLHRMRLQLGVDVYLPQHGTQSVPRWTWDGATGGTTRMESVSTQSAYTVAHLRVAF